MNHQGVRVRAVLDKHGILTLLAKEGLIADEGLAISFAIFGPDVGG